MLNGAEGLGELTAGLVAQGLTILDSVKKNLASSSPGRLGAGDDDDGDDGEPRALPGGSVPGSANGGQGR